MHQIIISSIRFLLAEILRLMLVGMSLIMIPILFFVPMILGAFFYWKYLLPKVRLISEEASKDGNVPPLDLKQKIALVVIAIPAILLVFFIHDQTVSLTYKVSCVLLLAIAGIVWPILFKANRTSIAWQNFKNAFTVYTVGLFLLGLIFIAINWMLGRAGWVFR